MTICPYTGKNLEEIKSEEDHIISLSLGGSSEFKIRCSKKFNNEFGSKVEQRLLDNPMFLANHHNAAWGHRRPKHHRWVSGHLFDKDKPKFQGRPVKYRWEEDRFKLVDARTRLELPGVGGTGVISYYPCDRKERVQLLIKVLLGYSFLKVGDSAQHMMNTSVLRQVFFAKGVRCKENAPEDDLRFIDADLLRLNSDFKSIKLIDDFIDQSCDSKSSIIALMKSKGRIHLTLVCRKYYIGSLSAYCHSDLTFDIHDSGDIIKMSRNSISLSSAWNYSRNQNIGFNI